MGKVVRKTRLFYGMSNGDIITGDACDERGDIYTVTGRAAAAGLPFNKVVFLVDDVTWSGAIEEEVE